MSPAFLEKGQSYSLKGRKAPIKFLYKCPWAAIQYPKYVFEGSNGSKIELSPQSVQNRVSELTREN
jgi:hypothetical protein